MPRDGYVLFLGTLEPRKNLGVLLDAYAALLRGSRARSAARHRRRRVTRRATVARIASRTSR